MTIAVGVVAHVQRRVMAEQLAEKVGAAVISVDDGTLGCDQNHRVVLTELAALNCDYSCILEDDVIPVVSFTGQLTKIAAVTPSPITSLYTGRMRPPQFQTRLGHAVKKAQQSNSCFIMADRLFSAQGVLIKTDLIAAMLAELNNRPIDEAVSHFARRHRIQVAHTMPSIIEHRDGDTLVKHRDRQPRTPGRIAWSLGTRNTWTAETVTM